jgi:hypothetical protein
MLFHSDMTLTDLKIRKAKGREKPYKMADGGGLYALIQPSGSIYWRYDFKLPRETENDALGVCPAVPLERAREKTREARKLVSDGIDPIEKAKRDDAAKGCRCKQYLRRGGKRLYKSPSGVGSRGTTIKKNTWLLCSCL